MERWPDKTLSTQWFLPAPREAWRKCYVQAEPAQAILAEAHGHSVARRRATGDYFRYESVWASAKFLQTRMQLGWGTARVAFGMALTDFVYNACKRAQLSS
eukprot:s340_g29.t1